MSQISSPILASSHCPSSSHPSCYGSSIGQKAAFTRHRRRSIELSFDDDDSLPIDSEDFPPRKKPRDPGKLTALLEDDEASTSDNNAAPAIDDGLTRAWHTNLERLHHCTTNNKYAAATSTPTGDWDFDREDVAFAMESLLPWTKELFSPESRPTRSSFKGFCWIDTKAPGVHARLAIKRDWSGSIV